MVKHFKRHTKKNLSFFIQIKKKEMNDFQRKSDCKLAVSAHKHVYVAHTVF